MKKLINKMATPMFNKITMTTRMGAEPCRKKREKGISQQQGKASSTGQAEQEGSGDQSREPSEATLPASMGSNSA